MFEAKVREANLLLVWTDRDSVYAREGGTVLSYHAVFTRQIGVQGWSTDEIIDWLVMRTTGPYRHTLDGSFGERKWISSFNVYLHEPRDMALLKLTFGGY
jgi:hypothetical protein